MPGRRPVREYMRLSTWALEPAPSTFAPTSKWSNKDMDPVPPNLRTWQTYNYIAYWISDALNPALFELASSMLAIGLSCRQALPVITVAHTIMACVIVLNGTIGARLHVGFPVLNRSSFGFWFSYFSVISRTTLSLFWFGVQTYTGLMCYFLYWLFQLPFLFMSPQKLRWLFLVKAIVVPAAWFAILIWAAVTVPISQGLFAQRAQLSGAPLSWAWLSSMNSALGTYATLAVNIPDFTRYAKNERAQYIQMAVMPITFTTGAFIGMMATSAGAVLYGKLLWDPLQLINEWDNRAAAFFAAASFMFATLGTNISANSLGAANDMMAMCPRYINIRRGQIICAVLGGWALCPWEILASAEGFLSFMSGYTVFLGPIAGIMVTDYWLVHRCRVDVRAMYDPHGRYKYTYGCNWRAVLTMLVTIPPLMPGLINSINPKISAGGATHLFDIAWLYGFFVASAVYFVASAFFPAKETYIDKAILPDDTEIDDDIERSSVAEKESVDAEIKTVDESEDSWVIRNLLIVVYSVLTASLLRSGRNYDTVPTSSCRVRSGMFSNWQMKSVLVTGSTGFVGAHIVDELLRRGIKVKAAARSHEKAERMLHDRAQYKDLLGFRYVGDLTDPNVFDDAAKDVDAIIHTASPVAPGKGDLEANFMIPAIVGTNRV
ncbi:hypothetical protein NM688_g7911 [Phlebia brevispora]|uniref:Uncharacterized protein n=1 Tax=Phlebia brevispora TaxID=194682 RepID=A0ACC1RZR6_9APHY|nr:hypothetical protein NM688_g7911 [Phlebia brevispora]